MKVLLLVTDAYGCDGGIALCNRDLAEALTTLSDTNEVVVIPCNIAHAPGATPARIRMVPAAAKGKLGFVKSAMRAAGDDIDLVVCGHINLLALAVIIGWVKKRPVVLMVHGIDVWQQPSPLARVWLRGVTAVWSVSALTLERMQQWARLEPARCTVLPNAIHLEHYGLGEPRKDLVARHGLQEQTVLLTLGRLSASERYKGVDEVLEVLPELIRRTPKLKYLVAGDGDDRQRLLEKSRRLGLHEHVEFVGFIAETEKADYYRLADVFVMPGWGEGFGFVYLEALACGIPVVGSRLDGSREALLDGQLGELADPHNPESIRTAILAALEKPKQIPAALAYFAWPAFVDRLAQAVRTALSSDED